jgi:hypothetical protein
MKTVCILLIVLSLSGCAEISGFINQSQAALEQANRAKGLEAQEILCNRLYTRTFQELYGTKQEVEAWKVICKDRTEFTP